MNNPLLNSIAPKPKPKPVGEAQKDLRAIVKGNAPKPVPAKPAPLPPLHPPMISGLQQATMPAVKPVRRSQTKPGPEDITGYLASQKPIADSKTQRRINSTQPITAKGGFDAGRNLPSSIEAEMAGYDRKVFGFATYGTKPKQISQADWDARQAHRHAQMGREVERDADVANLDKEIEAGKLQNLPFDQRLDLAKEAAAGLPGFYDQERSTAMISRLLGENPELAKQDDLGLALSSWNQAQNVASNAYTAASKDPRAMQEMEGGLQTALTLGDIAAQFGLGAVAGGAAKGNAISKAGQLATRYLAMDAPGYAQMIRDSGGVGGALQQFGTLIKDSFDPTSKLQPSQRIQGLALGAAILLGTAGKVAGSRGKASTTPEPFSPAHVADNYEPSPSISAPTAPEAVPTRTVETSGQLGSGPVRPEPGMGAPVAEQGTSAGVTPRPKLDTDWLPGPEKAKGVAKTPKVAKSAVEPETLSAEDGWITRAWSNQKYHKKADAEIYYKDTVNDFGAENVRLVQDPTNPKLWSVKLKTKPKESTSTPTPEPPTAQPAKAEKAGGKEPWQITRNEFNFHPDIVQASDRDFIVHTLGNQGVREKWDSIRRMAYGDKYDRFGKPLTRGEVDDLRSVISMRRDSKAKTSAMEALDQYSLDHRRIHKAAVSKALSEGKPVPPEVLADYPDLKPRAAETPAVKTPEPKPKEMAGAKGGMERQGITQADTKAVRETLDFAPYSKLGKPLAETTKNVRKSGLVDKAESIARDVNAKPRPLTDEETVAVGIRFTEALDDHTKIEQELGKAYESGDQTKIADLEYQKANALDRTNELANALDKAGTEWGRGGKARQIAISRGYDERSVIYKAVAAKKGKLSAEELAGAKEQAARIKELEAQVAAQEKALAERVVQGGVTTHPRAKRANKIFSEDRYAEIQKRRMQANAQMKPKQRGATSLTPQDFADLAFSIGYWTEKGIRSAPEIITRVREMFPEATHEDIALAGRAMQEARREGKTPRVGKPTLGQMLAELDRLGGLAKEPPMNLAELKAKAREISKLPEGQDLEAMKAWQEEVHKLAAKLNTGTSLGSDVFTRGQWGVQDPELTKVRYELRRAKQGADAWVAKLERDREYAAMSTGAKIFKGFVDSLQLPRAIQASTDLSAVGRQGLMMSVRNPKAAGRSFVKMVRSLQGDEAAHRVMSEAMDKYERSGRMADMQDGGLALTDFDHNGIKPAEEDFATRLIGFKIKLEKLGLKESKTLNKLAGETVDGIRPLGIVRTSERGFVTFINLMRMEAFDAMATSLERNGPRLSKEELKGIANFVNVATGRGDLGSLGNSPIMSKIFYSPRFTASRIQYLLGQPIAKGGSARVRWAIAKEYAIYVGVTATMLALAKAGGLTEEDPRSSDAGKIKIGNRRYDITGGLGTHLTMGARMLAPLFGQASIKTADGKYTNNTEYAAKTYGRSRLAPLPGLAGGKLFWADKKTGQPTNAINQPMDAGKVAKSLFMPLGVSQTIEDANERYDGKQEPTESQITGFIANFFGISSSAYGGKKK